MIVHQMTALGSMRTVKHFDRDLPDESAENRGDRIPDRGSPGCRDTRSRGSELHGLAQIREGSRIKTEDEPLDPNPPNNVQNSAAIRTMESLMTISRALREPCYVTAVSTVRAHRSPRRERLSKWSGNGNSP